MRIAIELAISLIVIFGVPILVIWFVNYITKEDFSICVHCIRCVDYEQFPDGDGYYECEEKGIVDGKYDCGRFRRVMPWRRRKKNASKSQSKRQAL